MTTREEKVHALHTMIARHRNDKGLCRCCGQPWPCDLRILANFFKGWKAQVIDITDWKNRTTAKENL